MTTSLLLSSNTCRCTALVQVVAAATEQEAAAADTAEGESIATDAAATAEVAETAAITHTDETKKKERVLRKTWTLFHSVDSTGQANDTSFTPRAKVMLEIHLNHNNNAKPTTTTTPPVLTIENHPDCLSQDSVHRMMKTQWYQLKLVDDDDDSGSSTNNAAGGVVPPPPPVLATVPACRMRLANFR